jgi:hypothetical protein
MSLNISFAQINAFIGYNANMMSEENVFRIELKSTTIKGSALGSLNIRIIKNQYFSVFKYRLKYLKNL